MIRKLSRKKVAALVGIPASLIITRAAWAASTYTWTGNGLDALWTDSSNWTGGASTYPIGGDTLMFNQVAADGSNIVNLGGGTQGLTNLYFTNGAAAYTVGILNSGDQLNFNSSATIYASSNLANAQTINANIATAGTLNITDGNMAGPLTINGNIALGGALSLSGASISASIVFNGSISGSFGVTYGNTSNFTTNSVGLNVLTLTGQNSYTGNTQLTSGGTYIRVGSSSVMSGSTIVSGPFGTGTMIVNASNNDHLQPINGSQVINNPMTIDFGLSMESAQANDPNSLTFAGPITFSTSGRFIGNGESNNASTLYGATMYLGLAGTSASTLTLTNNGTAAQTVDFAAITGPIVINDVIQNNGTNVCYVTFNPQAGDTNTIQINSQSIYSGSTSLSAGNYTGMGAIEVATSTTLSGASITSGPFGTGTLIMNNATTPPMLIPFGADRTIANPIIMSTGFWAANATLAQDPTGPHNLILTGPIAETNNDRTLTNNMVSGVTLTLGSATAASTITLGSTAGRFLTIQSQATSGGGVTIINDVIQDSSSGLSGTVRVISGTTFLNANNTFSGGFLIQGGTAIISADLNMGSVTGNLNLSSTGTLLDTGTFSTSRPIVLSGTNIGSSAAIDVSSGQTLTLTGGISGTGDLTKGTSSGTLQLAQAAGGSISGNVNVNGGTLLVGPTGGQIGAFGIGGTLTINDGAVASIAAGVSSNSVTNAATSLVINGSGQLNLANSSLLTSAPSNTIRQYLIAGYNGGASNGGGWNGTGGISSVNAATNVGHTTALGYSSGTTIAALGLSPGQTLVKYTIYGDANLDGSVDISDLDIVLSNYASGKPPTWDTGDFTYAGQTDITDLNIVLSNYAKTAPNSVATPTVARSSVKTASTSSGPQTLTGTVSPAVASGAIELDVNTITGDAVLNPNNVKVVSLQVASSSGNLIPNNWKDLSFYYGTTHWADSSFQTINLAEYDTAYTSRHDSLTLTAPVDYGDIFNTSGPQDLTFEYGVPDADGSDVDTEVGAVVYSGITPEPTTLGLMGLAMAGLMGRRRRRK